MLLEVEGLVKHFPVRAGILRRTVGHVHAVDGVSFAVNSGETLGLVGESGCGKSTLGRTLIHLYPPTEGAIRFQGQDVVRPTGPALRGLRRDMQMIFQDPFDSLNARHTVGEIIEEPLIIHRLGADQERRRRVSELLERVGLPTDSMTRYPHEFSGGQRQRIGIARALALNPKLIICDEPVSALDVSVQAQVLNLLLELQRDLGLTYLFIAHDLAVVKHVSDRIAVMYLGRIVEMGQAQDVYLRPRHPYTRALIAAVPQPDAAKGWRPEKVLGGEVPSPINPPSGCRFHTRCPFAIDDCRTLSPTLRELPGAPAGHRVACHRADDLAP